ARLVAIVVLPHPPLELATRTFSMSLSLPVDERCKRTSPARNAKAREASLLSRHRRMRCARRFAAAILRLPALRRIGRHMLAAQERDGRIQFVVLFLQMVHVDLGKIFLAWKARAQLEEALLLPGGGALARERDVARRPGRQQRTLEAKANGLRAERAAGFERVRERPAGAYP